MKLKYTIVHYENKLGEKTYEVYFNGEQRSWWCTDSHNCMIDQFGTEFFSVKHFLSSVEHCHKAIENHIADYKKKNVLKLKKMDKITYEHIIKEI